MLGTGIEAFGLRDDAAVLDVPGGGPLVVSVDSVVEGVHVDLAVCSPGDVGWKALMGAAERPGGHGRGAAGRAGGAVRAGRLGRGRAGRSGVMAGVAEASARAAARWWAATCRRRGSWWWP